MASTLTPEQSRSLTDVLAGLTDVGYAGELLELNYCFGDWLNPSIPERTVEAAAFGRTPVSSDSACFAVVTSNGRPGIERIRECRALGAPRAFEIDSRGHVFHWRVGVTPIDADRQSRIDPKEIGAEFLRHAGEWAPEPMLRTKNIGPVGPRQLDFIDLGLMPAIEESVREKIDPLLRDTLHATQTEHVGRTGVRANWVALFQLVFRALTGKIMHDRGVPGFRGAKKAPTAAPFLEKVAAHYNEPEPAAINDPHVRQVVIDRLWAGVNLKHISVETLAYVWENTLLTQTDRRSKGIHATPPSLAKYIVRRLLPEGADFPGTIVEPCCGAATFLVAAMQQLRDLLPLSMSGAARHKVFKDVLYGFDTEAFGLEVAKCRLMLADFPHPNKWKLSQEDVFGSEAESPDFHGALKKADMVFCNPPFGEFTASERRKYDLSSLLKPVELMGRVLSTMPKHGTLGFVMPLQMLSGQRYKAVREQLARRFDDIEVVSLPDKVFEKAQQETALVIARGGRPGAAPSRLLHRKVDDRDWAAFRDRHVVSSEAVGATTPDDAAFSLALPDLPSVWAYLSKRPRLKDVADLIRRGIEWNVPLDENRDQLIASVARKGFRKGIASPPRGSFLAYQCPPVNYLRVEPDYQRRAFDLPWDRPKAIMSAKRKSRSPWRIASFADSSGLVCYQTFTCIWPTPGWTAATLTAILNSPVANAFASAHEGNRDITNEIIAEIPIPSLSRKTSATVDALVAEYTATASSSELFDRERPSRMRHLLRQIDAAILKAYELPSALEQEVLNYFVGSETERPVAAPSWSYTAAELDRAYAEIAGSLLGPAWLMLP